MTGVLGFSTVIARFREILAGDHARSIGSRIYGPAVARRDTRCSQGVFAGQGAAKPEGTDRERRPGTCGVSGTNDVSALRCIGLGEVQNRVAHSERKCKHLELKKTTGELHGGMKMPCAVLNGASGNVRFGVTNVGRI